MRSGAVVQRLEAAERELVALRELAAVVDVGAIMAALPAPVARYRTMVADLGNAPIDIAAGREWLKEMVGEIGLRPEANRGLVAEIGLSETPSRALAGSRKIWRGSGGPILHTPTVSSGLILRVLTSAARPRAPVRCWLSPAA